MGLDEEEHVATTEGDVLALERSTAPPPPTDNTTVLSESALSGSPAESEYRPALPPRPTNLSLLQDSQSSTGSGVQVPKATIRPRIVSTATTALSRTDIHTQSFQDGSRETFAASAQPIQPARSYGGFGGLKRFRGFGGSDTADSSSIRSYAPTIGASGDAESLLGEVLGSYQERPPWDLSNTQVEGAGAFELVSYEGNDVTADFYREFDEIPDRDIAGGNEGRHIASVRLALQ